LVFTVGAGSGFVQVGLYTWIQHRIPSNLLGRVISIMTLVITAIAPISALLAGALMHYATVPMLFMGMGALLSCFAVLASTSRVIRSVKAVDGASPAGQGGEAAEASAGANRSDAAEVVALDG